MSAKQAETSASGSAPLQGQLTGGDGQPSKSGSEPLHGEVKDVQDTSVPGIENLPDGVLVQIFHQVSDGVTFQEVLPAVSQRWEEVAREARRWRDLTDIVKGLMSLPPEGAPFVADLYVEFFLWPTERRVIPDRCVVRDLSRLLVSGNLSMVEDDVPRSLRQGYLEAVWRSRHQLKRLVLVLDNTTKTDLGHSSLFVLSHMPCLEELTVNVEADFVYESGQLKQVLPNLKSFEVVESETSPVHHDLIRDLLVDGLVSAKFRPGSPARPALLMALAKCKKLTDLNVHFDYAPVFRSLPALKSVTVHLTLDSPIPINILEQTFVSAYTPRLDYLHVIVYCKLCPVCHSALHHECQRILKAVEKLGCKGGATYLVLSQF
ncbi:uncharacterized protein LOC117652958 [Thrips palmi]|uniref:Uncharacterized protein LOC117652958 n=1 Tax=Thrips palmi TaxID=161013 RepID=A0A6P9A7Z7_THRPL|nr:uncharacterized protein LOC117652958 [Thrips palmi]XP_034254108.1 uncharacterized protein LOC117652958 [Thrips palmi]